MNTLHKNNMVNYDIINNHFNVKAETSFLGSSLSQPKLNGEMGNQQPQYLLLYIS
jgi:hypothetical protein